MTINRTVRLFDEDSHQYVFRARVLACVPIGECFESADPSAPARYDVILDATAFFPEGGGQAADPGTLAGYPVLDVQEIDGVIHHYLAGTMADVPVGGPAEGSTVEGIVDADTRLRRMQNHSGEHIISGLIHAHYGLDNVGFHLGANDVTLDFNGVLTREQLDEIENEANRLVAACLPVKAYYPDPAELSAMTYRAKLDLTENVRIVEIGEDGACDRCACCAPHVRNTGEIGMIKLLDLLHYKGGVRIHMQCGLDALDHYRHRYTAVAEMAAAMSVKQEDVISGFQRLQAELEKKRQTITDLRRRIVDLTVAALTETDGNLCVFLDDPDMNALRHTLNAAVPKCGRMCGVFGGNDADGYRFVIGRGDPSLDLRPLAKEINAALHAKGGGSSEMLQGNAAATREEIRMYFYGS